MSTKKRKRVSRKPKLESYVIDEVNGPKIKIEVESDVNNDQKPDHNSSYHNFTDEELRNIRKRLLDWYDKNQRRMPWRKPSDNYLNYLKSKGLSINENESYLKDSDVNSHAYAVLVSEIMLQQTQVATVISYFNKWMKEFPNIQSLADASPDRVRELWAGLGYYRRANLLHQCAQIIVKNYNGIIPSSVNELEKLPGIGKYTAGAISSVAFGKIAPIVDGNIIRVLTRLRAIAADPKSTDVVKLIWKLSSDLVDESRPGDFNQSLMELGATICTVQNPNCSSCPVRVNCLAHKEVISENVKSIDGDLCNICTNNEKTVTVTKYPIKSLKKKKKDLHTHVCIIKNIVSQDVVQYLMVKRPENGLLGGFWEFPSVDLNKYWEISNEPEEISYNKRRDIIDEYLKDKLDQSLLKFQSKRIELGNINHIFTHISQKLWVEMLVLETNKKLELNNDDEIRWCENESFLNLAISKSVKNCYNLTLQKRVRSSKKFKKSDESSQTTLIQFFKK